MTTILANRQRKLVKTRDFTKECDVTTEVHKIGNPTLVDR
jgi:hypothetical protein